MKGTGRSWTQQNRTELTLNWRGEENEERTRRAANTSILLIQSGHTLLRIILLIIPERSIAALNQTELWVHSLRLWPSNTARLCDSQREHHLTASILSPSLSLFQPAPLSSSLFLTLCARASLTVNLTSLQTNPLPWFSLSLISIFYSSDFSRFSLSNSDRKKKKYCARGLSRSCLWRSTIAVEVTVLLTEEQTFFGGGRKNYLRPCSHRNEDYQETLCD